MKKPPELSKMTKTELTSLARRKKIPLASGMLKDDMVKAVKKGLRKIEAQKKSKTGAKTKKKTKAKSPAKQAAKKTKSKKVKRSAVKKTKTAARKKAVRKPKAAALKKAAPRKSTVKKKAVKPEAKKPAARKSPPSRSQPEKAELPKSYGEDRLVVMPRDPNWAYAYWDLTPSRVRGLSGKARKSGGQPRWVLRVYAAPLHPQVEKGGYFDVEIDVKSGSYYLDLSRPGARFIVEIGVVETSGMFHSAAQSNPVIMPRDHPSETTASQGMFYSGSSVFQQKKSTGSSGPTPGEATSPQGSSWGGPHSSESQ